MYNLAYVLKCYFILLVVKNSLVTVYIRLLYVRHYFMGLQNTAAEPSHILSLAFIVNSTTVSLSDLSRDTLLC